jgi:hypothetical protein
MPERIQLSRAKGARLPRGTMKVDRSTAYGNPFRAAMYKDFTAADAVSLFRRWMNGDSALLSAGRPPDIGLLRGKNLACWCKPGTPCHADVLLELANKP